jgi:hypothetical protein
MPTADSETKQITRGSPKPSPEMQWYQVSLIVSKSRMHRPPKQDMIMLHTPAHAVASTEVFGQMHCRVLSRPIMQGDASAQGGH